MKTIKLFSSLLLIASFIFISGSCTSSKKMKKKCRECPEFSKQEKQVPESMEWNEKI